MDWRIKGCVQKALSTVPGGPALNDWLQRSVGGLRNFEDRVDSTVAVDWAVLASYMMEVGVKPQGLDYVEVGTGWYPTLPICFSLAGARSCRTYDIIPHLNPKLTFRMLRRIAQHLPQIAESSGSSLAQVTEAYDRLMRAETVDDLLRLAGIEYMAPADAAATALPDASIDIFYSNNVLEHVPTAEIVTMLRESRRILRPGGLSLHCADCGDHYAYFDRSITFINYLKYSDSDWRSWNNPLLYQNRLRPLDYQQLAETTGLRILSCKYRTRPESLKALPRMKIAPNFRQYPADQLCATSVGLVTQR